MKLEEFSFHLPPELIAQHPPERRDGGRLMLLDRDTGEVSHRRIADLPLLLPPRCLLVVNDSRVLPARLRARRGSGGKVEVLLVERLSPASQPLVQVWTCMLRSSKPLREGEALQVLDARGEAASCPPLVVLDRPRAGRCKVQVSSGEIVQRFGAVPLPPYIRREAGEEDRLRYQTVYALEEGSVAAPTAGLHFTEELLARVEAAGCELARVTLHVGPGTFTPVRADRVEEHRMEQEAYFVPPSTERAILKAREEGRPVVAVGTTVVRTLETSLGRAGHGRSELFIYPGHRFQVVDGLVTNFHLPGSTLLMLVSALAGREALLAAYQEAVAQGYRFYSYGDAMLLRRSSPPVP